MNFKRVFLLCSLLSLITAALYSQETETEETDLLADADNDDITQYYNEDETEDLIQAQENEVPAAERQRIELEIRTSTLPELAAWNRSLGLSEGGTRADLSRRLRDHLNLPEPTEGGNDNQKIITIESAQTTEYFTIEAIDEDYARLKGEVHLSLQDKDTIHRISAEEILFNRTRNIITARGTVEYIQEKRDSIEVFRGENITVNIDNWESIFLDGVSERKLESDGATYRFEGRVISRTDEDVTILSNASISNANNEEALWSISAARLLLLPGSDFYIFNAWLKVGEIPVLYIPAFFYPADEVVFRPVIGYRSREGAFVQTTTYILGRPKANATEQSSLSRILGGGSDMETERHGLFLRSTGRKMQNPDEASLRFIADYYTNLGAYMGLDLSTPRTRILNPVELTMGVGLTRTLTLVEGSHTPYAPNYDGTFDWNHSNLFSYDVPFRYRFRTNSSIRGRYGGISWNLPFYSDPYVDKDFLNRSESMDWFNMIQQGAALEEASALENEIGAYQWQLSGQLTPNIRFLNPFINNLSFSNLSTTLSFITVRDDEIFSTNTEHPGRFFFAPDKYTIYSVSGSISGTPLTLGGTAQSGTASTSSPAVEIEDPLRGIGTPRTPWPVVEEESGESSTNTDDKLVPPILTQRFDLPRIGRARFVVDYQLSPTSSSELQFRSGFNNWASYDQVDWSEIQSILSSHSGTGNLNFRMDHSEGFYSNVVTFSGSGTWRDFNYLNEEAEAYRTPQNPDGEPDEARVEAAKRQQYSQTNYSSSYSYAGTMRPLYRNPIFGQSNFQYLFRGTLVRSKRYTDGDGPELTPQWGSWVKEETVDGEFIPGLNSHRVTANITANIMNLNQNLSVSADIPPFDPHISTNATFRVWLSETNARMDFKKPEKVNNEPNEEWILDPLHLTETLRFGRAFDYRFYIVLDPEEDYEITTITSSLTLWDFRASFSSVKSLRWKFEPNPDGLGGNWQQQRDEDPALHPRDLTFSYVRSLPRREVIPNRFSFSANVNSRLFFDLQRHTNSNFQFTTGITMGINNFLDLTLSATSENAVIFRYFKNIPAMEHLTVMYMDGPQNNVFIDLLDSFNFFDDSKRQRSGFKMKRFNLSATHHMGDWTATFDIAMSPYLNMNTTPQPKYEINADISFLIQWSSITEIKSDIKYEKRTETWSIQ